MCHARGITSPKEINSGSEGRQRIHKGTKGAPSAAAYQSTSIYKDTSCRLAVCSKEQYIQAYARVHPLIHIPFRLVRHAHVRPLVRVVLRPGECSLLQLHTDNVQAKPSIQNVSGEKRPISSNLAILFHVPFPTSIPRRLHQSHRYLPTPCKPYPPKTRSEISQNRQQDCKPSRPSDTEKKKW